MKELYAAFAKAQKEFGVAVKNKHNPHLKSDYADLASILDAVRPALNANGLTLVQDIRESGQCKIVVTILYHESGEILELAPVPIIFDKGTAQQYGSALTYARRYSATMATGVAQQDDPLDNDGHTAPKEPEAPAALPNYPEGKFTTNLPAWHALIKSGQKTHDQIVAQLSTKYTVTPEQRLMIECVQKEEANANA